MRVTVCCSEHSDLECYKKKPLCVLCSDIEKQTSTVISTSRSLAHTLLSKLAVAPPKMLDV